MSTDEKVDAWMPLWIGAYLADTMTLTTQQHGAYLLLLFAYWRNRGPLDDDDEDLSSIVKASPAEWKKLRTKLARFFTIDNGMWAHGRADKELATAGIRKANAVSKAKAGAEARWKKGQKHAPSDAPSIPEALPDDMLGQCPTPSPTPSPSESSVPDGTGDASAPPPVDKSKTPAEMAKAELWRAAVSVLEQGGCPAAQCRTFMGKLVADYGLDTVQKAVTQAVTAQPAEAREYLKATCLRLKGERQDPATVPSHSAAQTADYLAEQAEHARLVAAQRAARQAAALKNEQAAA